VSDSRSAGLRVKLLRTRPAPRRRRARPRAQAIAQLAIKSRGDHSTGPAARAGRPGRSSPPGSTALRRLLGGVVGRRSRDTIPRCLRLNRHRCAVQTARWRHKTLTPCSKQESRMPAGLTPRRQAELWAQPDSTKSTWRIRATAQASASSSTDTLSQPCESGSEQQFRLFEVKGKAHHLAKGVCLATCRDLLLAPVIADDLGAAGRVVGAD
jgi:hypothetical protein